MGDRSLHHFFVPITYYFVPITGLSDRSLHLFFVPIAGLSDRCLLMACSIRNAARFAVGRPSFFAQLASSKYTESGKVTMNCFISFRPFFRGNRDVFPCG